MDTCEEIQLNIFLTTLWLTGYGWEDPINNSSPPRLWRIYHLTTYPTGWVGALGVVLSYLVPHKLN